MCGDVFFVFLFVAVVGFCCGKGWCVGCFTGSGFLSYDIGYIVVCGRC